MRFCLKQSLAAASVLSALVSTASAASLVRTKSVVHANSQGRLVRTVVVAPKVIQPKVASADTPAASSGIRPVSDEDLSIPELVEATAKKYDVDPLLVHSMISVESGYNPRAVSYKGAQGMMQLMPGTARRFGVSNAFDAKENIEGGVKYLKYLQSLFPDDPRLAIAAYNAGEAAVWKYNNQIPPYRETENYVYLVGQRYGKARREAEKKKSLTAAAVPALAPQQPAGPVYAPVQYYVDSQGLLHMRTPETTTP